ncbi:hypothetical protein BG003_000718 [Podila horticola]|nr:hypothetical protein BG003_000718 [Podila horticola]
MEQLAHLTRPLDLLVHESLLRYDADDPLTASIIAFANFVRPQIANIAKSVGAIRQRLEDRDQGLARAEDESNLLTTPKELAERIKTEQALKKTLNNNNNSNNNNNNNRNNYNNNRNNYQQGYKTQGNNNNNNQGNYSFKQQGNNNNNYRGNNDTRPQHNSQQSNQGNGNARGTSRGRSQSRRPAERQ